MAMDRSKWEYKKLTNVCSIQYGYPFDSKCFNENNQGRPLIRIRDVVRGFTETYTTENCPDEYIIKEGEFLVGMDGEFNISAWKSAPALLNQRVCKITADGKNLTDGFMYYLMKTKLKEIEGETAFVTVKHLSAKVLNKVLVQLPSVADQQRIVAELDCLNEMIAVKQEQLKEFDKLAQSIFYDMFGDPVENERGWKKEEMGNICTITSSKRIFANEYCEEGVPFYRGKEITELSKGLPISIELNISKERYEEIKTEFGIPSVGDILITAVGTIGNIWVVDDDRPFYFKDGNIIWLKDIKGFEPIFFRKLLSLQIEAYKHEMAQGCAYNALTIVNLKKMKALQPPLALQQEFADKISAIEAQKELVKQSIAETQHLLDYTMDKYFG